MWAEESHILITGGAGFIGQDLLSALITTSPTTHVTTTDIIQPPIPKSLSQDLHYRITSIQADLTDAASLPKVFTRRFDAVYLLHGLMSGGAEANLDLGLRVNVDSMRSVLDYLRKKFPGTVVVFTSSCAVYGAGEVVVESKTLPTPKTSYGAEKLIVEQLLNDFSRRGLLEGRIVRLPTVVVRPGKPSAAASSFCSGIVRESLTGTPNTLPVPLTTDLWICSPRTVIRNLLKIKDVPSAQFGDSRIVNFPGITVTVQQILDAVGEVGGKEAVGLVREERDESVERIILSWPVRFDTARAEGMGLEGDGSVVDAVREFQERLQRGE